jgi:SpoVK/Ycf46/Vps4 family AAA+-type ATPase
VASLAGKPLFSVSPSDIGLDPVDVEHNLESLFELAARWRAVLLFDEADVFLENRSGNTADLKRNALVAVLLRVLEYYSGILILTTNRINKFDIAAQSRVNLGIKYNDLEKEEKFNIFKAFLDSVDEEQIADKKGIIKWFKEDDGWEYFEKLNGRQIRNVLFSAASLASKEKEQLAQHHINSMAKVTQKFNQSLKDVVTHSRLYNEVGFNPNTQ